MEVRKTGFEGERWMELYYNSERSEISGFSLVELGTSIVS
jgi:hypothetical protein